MNKPLLILGAGGHASVLMSILKEAGRSIVGIVSPQLDVSRIVLADVPHYLHDEDVLVFGINQVRLVNGIGSLPGGALRIAIYEKFTKLGYEFESVVAPSAILSRYAEHGQGVQVLPGAIVQAGVKIGENTIVNSGAIVEHDCRIGPHNHIAPGAILGGQVTTGGSVHIGAGAVVIQNVSIGHTSVVGAGAIVVKDTPAHSTSYGFRSIQK